MRRLRVAVVAALGALSVVALPQAATAQGTIQIVLPTDDPFPAAPAITVHAINFPDTTILLRIHLRLAIDIGFGLVYFDSTVAGNDARFITTRLLPENRDIYAQASVLNQAGVPIVSATTLAGHTGPRLQLVSPSGRSGVSLLTRQPTFAWRSAPVTFPPGPWVYELFITNVATQETRSRLGITDSVFTIPDTLQANTSYRWKVIARLANGSPLDSAVANSQSSFVVAPADAPLATLIYQNFPNPFPAPSSPTTCIWFDLQTNSRVELSILDLRGHLVRTMIPSPVFPSQLPSGRYGRFSPITSSGCDARLSWDGTADNGRVVPAGIYLLRFRADNAPESVKKIVFRGR